jgi:hypothetical protein
MIFALVKKKKCKQMEYAFSAWKTDKKVAVLGGSGSYI